jgi:hypothetical protein
MVNAALGVESSFIHPLTNDFTSDDLPFKRTKV